FFFQAEDGIRDRNVTGVQTCALPICTFTTGVAALITVTAVVLTRLATILLTFRFRFCFRCWLLGRFGFFTTAEQRFQCAEEAARSEERRVGKAWRARRWAT